jgi:molybdopterin/thiamine biosynthesis adenylyltransferase
MDFDAVELTNLQRQIMHTQKSVGNSKVDSGKRFLEALNPSIEVIALQERATASKLATILPSIDVVLDCTDNFATRQLINAACAEHHVALVSGSALRLDGQLSVFDVKRADSPCYACVFPPDEAPEEINCATMGVFSPLVGIIGAMQAAQALQVLIGFGSPLIGRLLLWNARNTQIETIQISRNPDCPVCGHHHSI